MSQTQSLYRQENEIIDNFNFGKVLHCMQALKWTYYDSEPTIDRLKVIAEKLITDVIRIVESGEEGTWFSCATGGFVASAHLMKGDWRLRLEFVVAQWEGHIE